MIHDDEDSSDNEERESEHAVMNGRSTNEHEMLVDANTAVEALDGAMKGYPMAGSDDATPEAGVSERRSARAIIRHIHEPTRALSHLRLRDELQDQGRENRRAEQLAGALGFEPEQDEDGNAL